MDPTSRLRIATRIHYALLRHLGTGIDVGYMLKRDDYAREVLYVCQGSGDAELAALALKFEQASAEAAMAEASKASRNAAPQEAPESIWSNDLPEPGMTQAGGLGPGTEPTSSRWLTPSRWLELIPSPTVH